jgi:hypothetical protein
LVSYHIEQHLSLGGRDEPGEIFLSFLYRYGNVNPRSATHTKLSQFTPIRTSSGDAEADLSNVFLLDHCVELFGACWLRMHSRIRDICHDLTCSRSKARASDTTKCWSALAVVVGCNRLSDARVEYSRKTKHAS